jgi:hypothetical protein
MMLWENGPVAEDDLLQRIDRTLDARDREQRAWLEAQKREQREWLDAQSREQREWLDAMTERHVGITQRMIAAIDQLQAEIADQRAQIQANTQALLKVLDRLGPSPQQG